MKSHKKYFKKVFIFIFLINIIKVFSLGLNNSVEKNKFPKLFNWSKNFLLKDSLNSYNQKIKVGAERLELYLNFLKDKKVGVFSNQTSLLRSQDSNQYTHLVDTLLAHDVQIKKIFIPEHGFWGRADAGEHIYDEYDSIHHLNIISLYGDKKIPNENDLKDIDILIFDIQDVGVRFYTYISNLQYILKACMKYHVSLLILDRPNPNGFYVDGPVLELNFKSFVGMQTIPIVYGMTIAEYAQLIYFENWIEEEISTNNINLFDTVTTIKDKTFSLFIVPCENYTHHDKYILPVKPSPNLGSMQAIYLYPSLCLFEGTKVSIGRGTDFPFEVYGFPKYPKEDAYFFMPISKQGAKNPMYLNQACYGKQLSNYQFIQDSSYFTLQWLIDAWNKYPYNKRELFFEKKFFNLLAGNETLMEDIQSDRTEFHIRDKWKEALIKFKELRKKHLLYPDFE